MQFQNNAGLLSVYEDPSKYLEEKIAELEKALLAPNADYRRLLNLSIQAYGMLFDEINKTGLLAQDQVFMEKKKEFEQKIMELLQSKIEIADESSDDELLREYLLILHRMDFFMRNLTAEENALINEDFTQLAHETIRKYEAKMTKMDISQKVQGDINDVEKSNFQREIRLNYVNVNGEYRMETFNVGDVYSVSELIQKVEELIQSDKFQEITSKHPSLQEMGEFYLDALKRHESMKSTDKL